MCNLQYLHLRRDRRLWEMYLGVLKFVNVQPQSIVVLYCVFLRQATWLSSHKLRIWAELLQAELLLSSARRL